MRLINGDTLKTEIALLASEVGNAKYVDWLTNGVLKWLMKHRPVFVSTYCTKIQPKKHSMFEDPFVTYFYTDQAGQPVRIYLEDEFDKKDAAAGTLYFFNPTISLRHWLFQQNPLLIEARDFLAAKIAENPNTDLRKYTLDTLETHLEAWKAERERLRLIELAERMERNRVELERLANQPADNVTQNMEYVLRSATEAYSCILRALQSSDWQVRCDRFAEAWGHLTSGQDYVKIAETTDFEVFRLLTVDALEWEGAFKGNCIAGYTYQKALRDPCTHLLTLRRKETPAYSVFTVEMQGSASGWELLQLEQWGYKKQLPEAVTESDQVYQRTLRELKLLYKNTPYPTKEEITRSRLLR